MLNKSNIFILVVENNCFNKDKVIFIPGPIPQSGVIVIFEDKEDGETCYHFNMTILDVDLDDKI